MARRSILPSSSSPAGQLLRTLGLVFVFVAAALLFWRHYDKSLDRIVGGQQIMDETGRLSSEELERINRFMETLRTDYGLDLRLHVYQGRIDPPKLDPKTLFIGLSPKRGEWEIVFPLLLKKALPQDFVRYLQEEHFRGTLRNNGWPEALMNGLHAMYGHLSRLESGERTS
jgi:hypothetical protein